MAHAETPDMKDVIYLDYNATTPVKPEVHAAIEPFFTHAWANPISSHAYAHRVFSFLPSDRVPPLSPSKFISSPPRLALAPSSPLRIDFEHSIPA